MADLGYSAEQLGNAEKIISVGKGRGESQKAILTALMVGLDESELQNMANSTVPESLSLPHENVGKDSDSVGVFQQRPSEGWGTVAELMDPATAATKFYNALDRVPGRDALPAAVTAQRVQRSADPTGLNYAVRQPAAQSILDALYGTATLASDNTGPKLTPVANPLVAVGKITAWVSDPANMKRVGLFVLGAVVILIALYRLLDSTGVIGAAVKTGAKVAEVAAL